jgi:hypothetical protein
MVAEGGRDGVTPRRSFQREDWEVGDERASPALSLLKDQFGLGICLPVKIMTDDYSVGREKRLSG